MTSRYLIYLINLASGIVIVFVILPNMMEGSLPIISDFTFDTQKEPFLNTVTPKVFSVGNQ